MICQYCGQEIDDGAIWCPACGRENRMVPDYSLIEDTEFQEQISKQEREKRIKDSLEEEELNRIKRDNSRRRRAVIVIFTLIIIGAMVIGEMKYQDYVHAHSYDYQIEHAQLSFEDKDYESALSYADTASTLDSDKIAPWYILAYSYYELGDNDEAANILETVLNNGLIMDEYTPEDIYSLLCSVYDEKGEYDKIRNLAIDCKEKYEDEYASVFNQYLVEVPVFSELGGDYEKPVTVSLKAESSSYTIYYTLDGSEPDLNSDVYKEAIVLPEGETTITAVCVDSKGNMSLSVSQTYEITLLPPDPPNVTPASGTYTSAVSVIVEVPTGCTAYYTWDGSTPDEDSYEYKNPLDMPEGNNIFTVILIDTNGISSKTVTRNYVYIPDNTDLNNVNTQDEDSEDEAVDEEV